MATSLPPDIPNRFAVLELITLSWAPESRRRFSGFDEAGDIASIQIKLQKNREATMRFGEGLKGINAISRLLG